MKFDELKKKQIGGSHYKDMKIQPWDFYKGFATREEWVGYLKLNIIDYLVRKKNGLEDLKKAQHLMDVLVATEEEKDLNITERQCAFCGCVEGTLHNYKCPLLDISEDRM